MEQFFRSGRGMFFSLEPREASPFSLMKKETKNQGVECSPKFRTSRLNLKTETKWSSAQLNSLRSNSLRFDTSSDSKFLTAVHPKADLVKRFKPTALLILLCVLFSAFAVIPVCGQEAVGQSDRTLRGRERSAAHRVQLPQITEPLTIGDTIPDYLWDYKMPLYQGTKIVDSLCLRDYQELGKVLILDFFTTWCGPCVESVLYVDSMINTYGYDNIKLVPVCILESTSRWAAFANRVDWQIPTLFDWSYLHNPIQLRYDEQSGLMVIKDGILQGSVIKTSLTKANMDKMNAVEWQGITLEFKPERDWRTGR